MDFKKKWKHRNGNVYRIIEIANSHSDDLDRYPVMIVYKNVHNNTVWCRKLDDWHRSFVVIDE